METRTKVFWAGYVASILAAVMLFVGIFALAPKAAHAVEMQAGTPVVTAQANTTLMAQATKKTSNPYKDVTVKSVGRKAWNSIKWVKAKGGYKGVVKNGAKFYPFHNITRGEFTKVLQNLYGKKKVPNMKSGAKTLATEKWVKQRLIQLAKKSYGMKITWPHQTNSRVGRASVANFIYNFAHFDPALMP